jgi:hypothetical protein
MPPRQLRRSLFHLSIFAGVPMKWRSIALLQSFSPQEILDAEGFS